MAAVCGTALPISSKPGRDPIFRRRDADEKLTVTQVYAELDQVAIVGISVSATDKDDRLAGESRAARLAF